MYILKKNKPLGQRLSASELSALTLRCGAHESAERGHCLLEAVSLFAGEQFGDEPACVDPVLRIFGMGWNDGLPNDAARAQLKRYIPLLPGTRGDGGVSIRRSWMALDWCLRTHLPAWLDLAPSLAEHAARLRGLASLNDQSSLRLALFAVDWASHASARSRVQERDVARATAGGAALGVAWRAARNAAWDATKQAASHAAWDAAWDAARAGAWIAARSAAGEAVENGEWDAARAGSWAATWAASWAASRATTQAVARDAAWSAAWSAAKAAPFGGGYAAAHAAALAVLSPVAQQIELGAHELFATMIEARAPDRAKA